MFVTFALNFALTFTDSFFLARLSDTAAAAAGGLFPVLGLGLVVFSSVGQAGASVAGQLLGAGRVREAPLAYRLLVTFNFGLGLITSLCFLLLSSWLPAWLGMQGEMQAHAVTYFGIVGGCQFLRATQIAYANILNSRGLTRFVMAEATLVNLCNITLNLCFLEGYLGFPKLGVAGVAWATVVSMFAGLTLTACIVRFKLDIRFPRRVPRQELVRRLRSILAIGLPSALEPVSYQTAQTFLTTLVITWGALALAARTYVFNFIMLTTILWSLALGIGTQILIAHRVGAERFDLANRQMRQSLGFAISGNLLLAGLLAAFHVPLLGLLTSDPEVVRLASPLFYIALLVEPARAINIVTGGALRSTGDARYVAVAGVLLMWCVGVPSCFLLGEWCGLGLPGIYLGFAIDELTRGLVNYRRWRAGHWKAFRLSLRPAEAQ